MHSRSYITVRYAETDKMGIAHHSNYPVWFEVGRTDFIKMFGSKYSDMEKAGNTTIQQFNRAIELLKESQSYVDSMLLGS